MKLIVIQGATCSGKTDCSIEIAQMLPNSVIVNSDSRQVYARLNIGTGKVQGVWRQGVFWYKDTRHYLIDYVNPTEEYSMGRFILDYIDLLKHIQAENIILVGGTGLYNQSILSEWNPGFIAKEFMDTYETLRLSLQNLDTGRLQKMIRSDVQIDLNSSDFHNKVRLINAILRYTAKQNKWTKEVRFPKYDSVINLWMYKDFEQLKERIVLAVHKRIDDGIESEVQSLHGIGTNKIIRFGLDYRLTILYQMGQMTRDEWIHNMIKANIQYARKQIIWLNKFSPQKISTAKEAVNYIMNAETVP